MKKTRPKSKKNAGTRRLVEKDMPKSVERIVDAQHGQLRKAQIEASEARQKYADLYDCARVGYFTFDKKGHIIETNVTGASLFGSEKRSLTGQPFRRFITPGHFSIFQSHLQMALEIQSKQSCELKLTRKDGSLFDALVDTIAVMDGDGNFDHYRSSVTDITEITRAGTARLATFPQFSPKPIAEVDFAGQIHYLNPAAERLFPKGVNARQLFFRPCGMRLFFIERKCLAILKSIHPFIS